MRDKYGPIASDGPNQTVDPSKRYVSVKNRRSSGGYSTVTRGRPGWS